MMDCETSKERHERLSWAWAREAVEADKLGLKFFAAACRKASEVHFEEAVTDLMDSTSDKHNRNA